MKKLLSSALVVVILAGMTVQAKVKVNARQVKYRTTIECKNCVRKVTENVSFEKGVKDLKTDLASGTVTVTYDPSKTDTLKLATAIRKLGFKAAVIEDSEVR